MMISISIFICLVLHARSITSHHRILLIFWRQMPVVFSHGLISTVSLMVLIAWFSSFSQWNMFNYWLFLDLNFFRVLKWAVTDWAYWITFENFKANQVEWQHIWLNGTELKSGYWLEFDWKSTLNVSKKATQFKRPSRSTAHSNRFLTV